MAPATQSKVITYWPVITGIVGLFGGALIMAFNAGDHSRQLDAIDHATFVRMDQIEKRTDALESAFTRIETKVNTTNDNVSYMLGLMKSPKELVDVNNRNSASSP